MKLSLRHLVPTFVSFRLFQASLWLGVDNVLEKLTEYYESELRHLCCLLIPRKCLHKTPFILTTGRWGGDDLPPPGWNSVHWSVRIWDPPCPPSSYGPVLSIYAYGWDSLYSKWACSTHTFRRYAGAPHSLVYFLILLRSDRYQVIAQNTIRPSCTESILKLGRLLGELYER